MIYADFESILVSEDNEKQNLEDTYTNKCQKHAFCKFINGIIVESKYCSDVTKIHFNKKLRKMMQILKNPLKVGF